MTRRNPLLYAASHDPVARSPPVRAVKKRKSLTETQRVEAAAAAAAAAAVAAAAAAAVAVAEAAAAEVEREVTARIEEENAASAAAAAVEAEAARELARAHAEEEERENKRRGILVRFKSSQFHPRAVPDFPRIKAAWDARLARAREDAAAACEAGKVWDGVVAANPTLYVPVRIGGVHPAALRADRDWEEEDLSFHAPPMPNFSALQAKWEAEQARMKDKSDAELMRLKKSWTLKKTQKRDR